MQILILFIIFAYNLIGPTSIVNYPKRTKTAFHERGKQVRRPYVNEILNPACKGWGLNPAGKSRTCMFGSTNQRKRRGAGRLQERIRSGVCHLWWILLLWWPPHPITSPWSYLLQWVQTLAMAGAERHGLPALVLYELQEWANPGLQTIYSPTLIWLTWSSFCNKHWVTGAVTGTLPSSDGKVKIGTL